MNKNSRQQKLVQIIQGKQINNQHDLLEELIKADVHSNQATISRDLNELGVFKVKGIYCLPKIESEESTLVDQFSIETAGDNLIIIKSSPGKASAIGFIVDNLKLPEVIGTLAGDDTVFIAIKNKKNQSKALQSIIKHFASNLKVLS